MLAVKWLHVCGDESHVSVVGVLMCDASEVENCYCGPELVRFCKRFQLLVRCDFSRYNLHVIFEREAHFSTGAVSHDLYIRSVFFQRRVTRIEERLDQSRTRVIAQKNRQGGFPFVREIQTELEYSLLCTQLNDSIATVR